MSQSKYMYVYDLKYSYARIYSLHENHINIFLYVTCPMKFVKIAMLKLSYLSIF